MADVTCPLTFGDHAALVSDTSTLPAALQAILKDRKRTTKIEFGNDAGHSTTLTEVEARALLAYAKDHHMGTLVAALEEALRGLMRQKREECKR
jgi:hypothetical protein